MSAEEAVKNKTFVQKLIGKIVDNIRIKIENIHVRLEFAYGSNFTCGLILHDL